MKKIVRIIFVSLNIIAVIALVGCLLTKYVNPSNFPFFEVFAIVFPFIMIVNAGFIVCWLFTKNYKYYCFISGVSFLFGLSVLSKYVAFNDEKPAPTEGSQIKVLSYNIQAFNHLTWRKHTYIKREIFDFVKAENPDIICFQEYHHDQTEGFKFTDSLKSLGYRYRNYSIEFSRRETHYQGKLICSKYPIVRSGELMHSRTGNGTIWAEIAVNNDTIRVYNSHLESYRLSPTDKKSIDDMGEYLEIDVDEVKTIGGKLLTSLRKRGSQATDLIQSYNDCRYPIIQCGDFNSMTCSHIYRNICEVRKFKDAFLESGKGLGRTYNYSWWANFRLDYILVDPKFDCYEFHRPEIVFSDHYPIVSIIDLNNK